jgi:hypothetical protein
MVADQGQPAALGDFVYATLRIAPVANHIAQAQGFVYGRAIAEHGLERVPVGMNVRDDRDLHACFP